MIFITLAAHAADLPRTGQQDCFAPRDAVADGEPIACAGTGQDGEIQAGAAWPAPRFELTYCDAAGPCASQASDCDGSETTDVITDHLTGLMWARDQSLSDSQAWTEGLQWATDLSLCGFDDWHAPSVTQARTLVHFGVDDGETWLEDEDFDHLRGTWTSTTSAGEPDEAFVVAPGWGWTDPERKDSFSGNYTWAVRTELAGCAVPLFTGQTTCYDVNGAAIACAGTGQDGDLLSGEPWPSPRFTDNGDGTVTDGATGLTWLADADCLDTVFSATYPGGEVNWGEGLDAVAAMNAGTLPGCGDGFTDWRVPNAIELQSVISYEAFNPALQAGHPFVNAPNHATYTYWTSTSFAFPIDLPNRRDAWIVHMYDGSVYNYGKNDTHGHVWPVRGGILDGGDCGPPPDSGATGDTGTPPVETGQTGDTGGPVVVRGPRISSDRAVVTFVFATIDSVYTQTVSVTNIGDVVLQIESLDPTRGNGLEFPFAVDDEDCSNAALAPSETCDITIAFGPEQAISYFDQLEIRSNDPDQPTYRITVTGEGYRWSTGCFGGAVCTTGPGPAGLGGMTLALALALIRRRTGTD